jgi:hypothetical protein
VRLSLTFPDEDEYMTGQPISRSRIIVAVMVPFIILALIGLGITANMAYKLSARVKAEATYVGSESVILVRGNSTDHTWSEMHYRFAKKDGSEVYLHFLERASGSPPAKSIVILYDPTVEGQITRSEPDSYRWDRASIISTLLFVGLGMAAIGLGPCLAGVVLLIRERRRAPVADSPLPLPD